MPADKLPSKSQIFDFWKNRLEKLGFIVDWGEPGCWACGQHYGDRYDIRHSGASWREILQGWDAIPLQRCHIVPCSLGGRDIAANLFLMCRECHDLAPNTSYRELFFEWARAQKWLARATVKLRAAYDAFGVAAADEEKLAALLASRQFKSWVSRRYTLHRPQSGYASAMTRLTPATMIGLVVYYQRHREQIPQHRASWALLVAGSPVSARTA